MAKTLKRALFAMSGRPGQTSPGGGSEGVAGLGNRMAAKPKPRLGSTSAGGRGGAGSQRPR
ncbi:MAG: hypothetical protein WAM29_11945, partial [Methylocella sp.]